MREAIRLELGKYKGTNWVKWIDFKHNSLKYWTSWELGRPLLFMFMFLVLLAPELLNPLVIVWFLEKFWGWENFRKHSRFINYIEKENNKVITQ